MPTSMLGDQQKRNDALDWEGQQYFMENWALSLALKTEKHLIQAEGESISHLE